MSAIDWTIIALYLAAMIGLSWRWGRKHASLEDYYVGGRNLPWWAVGISTMATQTSAISFISIPAYVALKQGGGLTWLQYEFAVPLAMILVAAFLIPFFRKMELVSIYEYLELRFGPSVRTLVSGVFLFSRGLGTGVSVYAAAIVLSVVLELPLWATILLIGVATIIYDTLGGMTAVVYSDVIQMAILLLGLGLCILFAVMDAGGISAALGSLPAERWRVFELSSGIGDASTTPFWAFLVGGFFLYASYYGTDQSQAQRGLSAPTVDDAKKALVFNGLARFPLTLLYLALGVAAGAAYLSSPELQNAVPKDKPDYLVPLLILYKLPVGVRALLMAALLAAAMSSLDSALNSLSAVTVRDFLEKRLDMSGERHLLWGKVTTVVWGVFITLFAYYVGNISDTVIEAINKIGSAFYGPVLAAFLGGVLFPSVNVKGVFPGIIAGVALNLTFWLTGAHMHWMWWNAFGFVTSLVTALFIGRFTAPEPEAKIQNYTLSASGMIRRKGDRIGILGLLMGYFVFMLALAGVIHVIAS